jgi:hypothetical protein
VVEKEPGLVDETSPFRLRSSKKMDAKEVILDEMKKVGWDGWSEQWEMESSPRHVKAFKPTEEALRWRVRYFYREFVTMQALGKIETSGMFDDDYRFGGGWEVLRDAVEEQFADQPTVDAEAVGKFVEEWVPKRDKKLKEEWDREYPGEEYIPAAKDQG